MAASDSDLNRFVYDALLQGKTRVEIAGALRAAGWSDDRIDDALGHWAESEFPVPVPRPRATVSARDAFYYLVQFTTLGLSAWYFGALLFDLIDMLVPDPAVDNGWPRDIRWEISVLVVAFPLYLFVAARLAREVARDPAKAESGVRRWLTYLTLFVATLFIVGDLIGLIHQFLTGALTLRVALKMLTVAVIAGAIFGWYLKSVSGIPEKRG